MGTLRLGEIYLKGGCCLTESIHQYTTNEHMLKCLKFELGLCTRLKSAGPPVNFVFSMFFFSNVVVRGYYVNVWFGAEGFRGREELAGMSEKNPRDDAWTVLHDEQRDAAERCLVSDSSAGITGQAPKALPEANPDRYFDPAEKFGTLARAEAMYLVALRLLLFGCVVHIFGPDKEKACLGFFFYFVLGFCVAANVRYLQRLGSCQVGWCQCRCHVGCCAGG